MPYFTAFVHNNEAAKVMEEILGREIGQIFFNVASWISNKVKGLIFTGDRV
jgi:hypothetical protein